MLDKTKLTPCVSVIQKRVIRSSVMGRLSAPSATSLRKNGTTEPREPNTLPYRTTENRVPSEPARLLAATKILSAASLDAPYKLIGLAALSVDRAMTLRTLRRSAA